jgi:myo-inositol-1(or 4)-monophosphatase
MADFVSDLRQAEGIAREAGRRLLEERGRGVAVSTKGIDDVVTNVDLAVETFVRAQLAEHFPNDALLGEELGAERQGERTWLIDPVDGTLNLSRSMPLSSVSIALLNGGDPVVGCVYDPYRDELFSARRGGGVRVNGVQVRTAPTKELRQAVVAGKPTREHLTQFTNIATRCRDMRRLGTAALELAYVAAGRLDGFLEYGLNPWDTGAAVLLVTEGGGTVSADDGSRFDLRGRSTLASNGPIHDELVRAVAGR